jgi:hypothetical protein
MNYESCSIEMDCIIGRAKNRIFKFTKLDVVIYRAPSQHIWDTIYKIWRKTVVKRVSNEFEVHVQKKKKKWRVKSQGQNTVMNISINSVLEPGQLNNEKNDGKTRDHSKLVGK